MVNIVFSSEAIQAKSAYPANVTVVGFDNGGINLNIAGNGSSHTTFLDVLGAHALIEALTNALNRVEQVQP
jgi:hypothetical protein